METTSVIVPFQSPLGVILIQPDPKHLPQGMYPVTSKPLFAIPYITPLI